MPRRRAMSSDDASDKKISGHVNERHFANLIGGRVIGDSPLEKADVVDTQGRSHSVKAGTWWQIFLYARDRLRTNTVLHEIGDLAEIMVACLDAFPPTRDGYLADKQGAKAKLKAPMRRLRVELINPPYFQSPFAYGSI